MSLPFNGVTPESCPERRGVRQSGAHEVARCGVLEEIVGNEESLTTVRRDACEACCRTIRPSAGEVNSVLASLLYTRCSELIDSGAGAAFDIEAARTMALRNIAWDIPDHLGVRSYLSALERRARVACSHLGEPLASRSGVEGVADLEHACEHPKHTTSTTPSRCHACRDWTDPDGPQKPQRRLASIPDPPASGDELRWTTWAVGVTTAPRPRPTIDLCLDTLVRAGWEECWIFADAPVSVAERHSRFPVTTRQESAGAWPNYYLALTELVLRNPNADAYLLVQDDATFYDGENVRRHLERITWPSRDLGVVSLYCSEAYTAPEPGWHVLDKRWIWGALAFIFPREAAREFLCDEQVLAHRWEGMHGGLRNIDAVIGEWAERHDRGVYFPTPSLVQHIGDASTLWPAGRAWLKRKADRFAGDDD